MTRLEEILKEKGIKQVWLGACPKIDIN